MFERSTRGLRQAILEPLYGTLVEIAEADMAYKDMAY